MKEAGKPSRSSSSGSTIRMLDRRKTIAHGLAAEAKEVIFNKAMASGHDAFHVSIYASDAVHALTFFSMGWAAAIGCALDSSRTVGACVSDVVESDIRVDVEKGVQANHLRDIFGSPFRPVAIDPACLTWHDGIIVKIAQSIYEERALANLPILADALEEAGCTNAELLAHCRHRGPHVRGCWAVDLLLGKT